MEQQWADYEAEVIASEHNNRLDSTAVGREMTYVQFLSNSKGRGRPRKRSVEVELVGYNRVYHTWKKTPFDEWSEEVYDDFGGDNEARFMREIPLYARRR
tara:strand:+ start:2765 stop:3064 length:300 start_codon:yes stop_codon:yes gene_type:complete